MLRDVVVHITNDQPILVDLVVPPSPTDVTLICRNVRTMAGKKPVFVDRTDSTFAIPFAHIRFVEMPKVSVEAFEAETAAEEAATAGADEQPNEPGPLARLGWLTGGDVAPLEEAPADAGADGTGDDSGRPASAGEDSDGLDDDLLRRIREA